MASLEEVREENELLSIHSLSLMTVDSSMRLPPRGCQLSIDLSHLLY